jgi:hypothetical protein
MTGMTATSFEVWIAIVAGLVTIASAVGAFIGGWAVVRYQVQQTRTEVKDLREEVKRLMDKIFNGNGTGLLPRIEGCESDLAEIQGFCRATHGSARRT